MDEDEGQGEGAKLCTSVASVSQSLQGDSSSKNKPKIGRRVLHGRNNSGQSDGSEESGENNFSWRKFLAANPKHDIIPVPVWVFPHAPLQTVWDRLEDIFGVKVEYRLGKGKGDFAKFGDVFWIGSIEKYFGYMVQIKVEGYPPNLEQGVPTKWQNYLTDCFRIGHCNDTKNGSIIPPFEIWQMQKDWRDFLLRALTRSVTIPPRISEQIDLDKNGMIQIGARVEALDNNCVSRMKVGTVEKNVGKRLYIRYWDAKDDDSSTKGIWCHEVSGLVQPPGWSKTVGHEISSPENYNPKLLPDDLIGKKNPGVDIQVGMKLEAVDPINPSNICVATVEKVLKFGYMMVSFDEVAVESESGSPPALVLQPQSSLDVRDNGKPPLLVSEDTSADDIKKIVPESGHGHDMICYHITSPLIFNCGFCEENGLDLIPPKEYKDKDEPFEWEEHLLKTGSVPLEIKDVDLVDPGQVNDEFSKGSKLEAVDLVDTSLICLATVADVKERLLRIRFDGWPDAFDQWMYAKSPDIYPVGWCDAFKYPLTGPEEGTDFWKKYARPGTSVACKGSGKLFDNVDEYKFGPIQVRDGRSTSKTESKPPTKEQKSRKRKADGPLPISVDKIKEEGGLHKRKPNVQTLEAEKSKGKAQRRNSKIEVLPVDHGKVKEEAVMLGRKPKPISQAVQEKIKKQAQSLGLKPKALGSLTNQAEVGKQTQSPELQPKETGSLPNQDEIKKGEESQNCESILTLEK